MAEIPIIKNISLNNTIYTFGLRRTSASITWANNFENAGFSKITQYGDIVYGQLYIHIKNSISTPGWTNILTISNLEKGQIIKINTPLMESFTEINSTSSRELNFNGASLSGYFKSNDRGYFYATFIYMNF